MKKIYDDDFGTICVCAERYALGRQSYMPKLVADYIRLHIADIDDKAIAVIIRDIKDAEEELEKIYSLGNPDIDKPMWIEFRKFLEEELIRRGVK